MEREVLEQFQGKGEVGLLRVDCGREYFVRCRIMQVTDNSVIVERNGLPEAFSLDHVKTVRVLNGSEQHV